MDRDVPLKIDLRIEVKVEHVKWTNNWRSSSIYCLHGFFPGILERCVFNLSIRGVKQLSQVFVLARAGCTPINLAGWVGEIKPQVCKSPALTKTM